MSKILAKRRINGIIADVSVIGRLRKTPAFEGEIKAEPGSPWAAWLCLYFSAFSLREDEI
jgi:hypothetical protein